MKARHRRRTLLDRATRVFVWTLLAIFVATSVGLSLFVAVR